VSALDPTVSARIARILSDLQDVIDHIPSAERKSYEVEKRVRSILSGSKKLTEDETFWRNVDMSGGPTVCWKWTKAIGAHGYGRPLFHGKRTTSSRAAYEITHGPIRTKDAIVMHYCDNRACCNPAHLHLGTRKENRLDTIRKGRAKAPRGANSPAAKFTDEQVREIRAKYSKEKRIGYRTLAKEYGVSATTILRIIRNETYVKSNYTPPR